MQIILVILCLLGAQFSLTAFAPAQSGKAWVLWPFTVDSKPLLKGVGGLPRQPGSILTPVLAGLSGLGFLATALAALSLKRPPTAILSPREDGERRRLFQTFPGGQRSWVRPLSFYR